MKNKIIFGLIWLGFTLYAFIFAPPDQPETLDLIKNLSTGNWTGINPLIIALFNIMGIWPLIYSCVLFIDGHGQKTPAWLFATLSFGVGAFAILPYLALRQPNPQFLGKKSGFIKILDSRITGLLLTIGTITLVIYGLTQGNWADFIQQWQTSRFIHVMSLDFLLLSLLFPVLLTDDRARREMKNSVIFELVSLIPLFGALFYLTTRSPLNAQTE
ncbi:DUF2834 domain-containing protein [Planktothrix paucivesiculata]|uniref:DUF2834 domain-containing protein n=1 Tax=Planktothrix paucivesiculata PCC 9631 TaxID=671071 RepID=A0A7Z9C240_9CYAN|nr:DUF2834 domain-containing protein [Planktothrix paucivesiculata]VXD25710.1 conserved membrane hypothetical protein [Planktothrix paucivesiculata PCC 9631]